MNIWNQRKFCNCLQASKQTTNQPYRHYSEKISRSVADPAGPGKGGPRNMTSMQPPSVAIFFMTYFHRAGGAMAPSAPPGSATVALLIEHARLKRKKETSGFFLFFFYLEECLFEPVFDQIDRTRLYKKYYFCSFLHKFTNAGLLF